MAQAIETILAQFKNLVLQDKLTLLQEALKLVQAETQEALPYPLSDEAYLDHMADRIEAIEQGKVQMIDLEETDFWKRAQARAKQ